MNIWSPGLCCFQILSVCILTQYLFVMGKTDGHGAVAHACCDSAAVATIPTPFYYRAMLCIRGTSHGPVSVCLSVRH